MGQILPGRLLLLSSLVRKLLMRGKDSLCFLIVSTHRNMKGSFLFIFMHQRKGQFTTVVTLSTVRFAVMRFVEVSYSFTIR